MLIREEYKRPLKFIYEAVKDHKKLFYLFISWKLIAWFFYIVFPILIKLEMDQLAEQNKELFGFIEASPLNIFFIILWVIFAVKFVEHLINEIISLYEHNYSWILRNDLKKKIFSELSNMQTWIFLNERNKKVITNLWNDADRMVDSVKYSLWNWISNIFAIIWITSVLALINPLILPVILFSWAIIYYLQKIKEAYRLKESVELDDNLQHKSRMYEFEFERNTESMVMSWGFKSILNLLHDVNTQTLEVKNKYIKKDMILSIYSFVTENIAEVWIKLIIWYSVFKGTASVWDMAMSVVYISRIESIVWDLFSSRLHYNRFVDSLLKFWLFLDLSKETVSKDKILTNIDKIEVSNLGFSYPNFAEIEIRYLTIMENRIKSYKNDREYEDQLAEIEDSKKELEVIPPVILNEVNFTFEKGKVYGLVWRNWAWKTTLTSIIMWFFDSFNWSYRVNWVSSKELNNETFRDNISVVAQVPYVIRYVTVKDNLLLWVNKDVSDDEIMALLEKFWLKEKIMKHRKGLNAEVGWDIDFSGWEKQLIALIRVILQDRDVLIMDEWTNQLDAENEFLVMEELLKNKKDKIVIFVTHRMSTIKKADMIYCLEDWRISWSWSHESLVWGDNIYAKFYKKQVW